MKSLPEGIWFINGFPGSGKSTTARALAEALPKSAHIKGDELSFAVIGGRKFPPDTKLVDNEALYQLTLSYKHQSMLALSFYEGGFTPIIDFFLYDVAGLQNYLSIIGKTPLYFIMLNPKKSTILTRDKLRGTQHAKQWLPMKETVVLELGDVGYWFDNSQLTVQETVDLIFANAEKARV